MHLLIVEDDPRLGRLLQRLLEDDRHVVELATDGRTGLDFATATGGFDALILDIGLPDISGLEVARRLRASGSRVAILVLTARDAVDDRVAGLDAGADDYLVKPFAYRELAARLRALRRRSAGSLETPSVLSVGVVSLDEAKRIVTVAGERTTLSPREFALLECFLRHPDRVLTRDQLLDAAWPLGVAVTPNTVDAYVHLLRQKLGPVAGAYVQTERGVGYRMVQP